MGNSIINVVDANNPNNNRKSVDLLPSIFRTNKNTTFLSGVLDPLIQPAQIDRLSGWVGSKDTPTLNANTDNYIPSSTNIRQDYQLQPAVVVYDTANNVDRAYSFDDLINQLAADGSYTNKLDRLFKPEFLSYDPRIDWDKFVNYNQYYWVPTGPDSIPIIGVELKTVSTYSVKDDNTKNYFVMTPDGLSENPTLKLFRGLTYEFEIDSVHNFWFKTKRVEGTADAFNTTIVNNGINKGTITLTIDDNTPSVLYYAAEDNVFAGGQILIESITQNSYINVELDVIGKKHYKSGTGVEFSNGMKVNFQGEVYPSSYANKDFIVEGVGTAIQLVDFSTLVTPENYAQNLDDNFDGTPFDEYPFDTYDTLPMDPEYVTINRASKDLNPWSRYNRWVHQDVLITTAAVTGQELLLPQENRAVRPIIEFIPNLQLFNFGSQAVFNIDHIDTVTTNAFATANGQIGWYVDQVLVDAGDLIVFANDEDPLVKNQIYKTEFINNDGIFKINFVSVGTVTDGFNASVAKGITQAGTNWWYSVVSGVGSWIYGQQKITLNQAPLFNVFDSTGTSLSYGTSDFSGTKVFGYSVGTGSPDPVLGIPLEYKNIADQAFYLFSNYFMTDTFNVVGTLVTELKYTKTGFLRLNNSSPEYINVWTDTAEFSIPVVQFEVLSTSTSQIEITGIPNPGYNSPTFTIYVNDKRLFLNTDYSILATRSRMFISLVSALNANDRVRIEIYANVAPTSTGYYDIPLNWTNNPLNGPIEQFTLSELSAHAQTMAGRSPSFSGTFLGSNNSRDIPDYSSYGTRLITNINPLAFAGYFACNPATDLIKAIRTVGDHYNQYKLAVLNAAKKLANTYATPGAALDVVLHNVNLIKDANSPYVLSDMLAYGKNVITRNYKVEDSRFTQYTLPNGQFSTDKLSLRSVLVYHKDTQENVIQLSNEIDYTFDPYLAVVDILYPLTAGDTITVSDYSNTTGCFVPPTPTKLGLYPAFEPQIYVDDTYADGPQTVIQGHDGSITIAYGDIRDDVLLEFEKRIFNNLKIKYNADLLDINSILPGAFKVNDYSFNEVTSILEQEFLRWVGFYGFDYQTNDKQSDSVFAYNFSSAINPLTNRTLPGYWRGIYNYFYGTDRPHVAPWEMLGFSVMPSWWEATYGPAPYTNGNEILWQDLEAGNINGTINKLYARPGLTKIIPVDDSGNLLDPASAGIAQRLNPIKIADGWKFGDGAPVESAWKRNSQYPFAVQILLALTRPADYYSKLFDTSRIQLSPADQYVYTDTGTFIQPSELAIYGDTSNGSPVLASGYSAFLIETGLQITSDYITNLKQDLSSLNLQLLYKTGGFVTKDKLEITIDSVNPSTTNPGTFLNAEDYTVFLNQGAPDQIVSISGFIISVTDTGWQIKGYDTTHPYFPIFNPVASSKDAGLTIGGKSEPFVTWTPGTTVGPQAVQSGTPINAPQGTFYKSGQVVFYNNKYYRVTVSHQSGSTFNPSNFIQLPALPMTGGVSVTKPTKFETSITNIPYGTIYTSVQDIFNVLLGYGEYLKSLGFSFTNYNTDLNETLDWIYSGKEFLFWSTQGWGTGSVITLSPFASGLTFTSSNGIVDNVFSLDHQYSILKADGAPLVQEKLTTNRLDNNFSISPFNTNDGIYFASLRVIQIEHDIILNNQSYFNDIIYDIESGYRQARIKIQGFRSSSWNGGLYSPGFVYDKADVEAWSQFTDYQAGDAVKYTGNYYSALANISGTSTFNFSSWQILPAKPGPRLLPNFDLKASQFNDFYSIDVDNYDVGAQKLAQHLIGYSPRVYLDNIFSDQTTQYKFYQGYIKEKGTLNAINKIDKASLISLGTSIGYNEEWAIRVGAYGSYSTAQDLEISLDEESFIENPQIINFVNSKPYLPNDFLIYKSPSDLFITPSNYNSSPFTTINFSDLNVNTTLPTAGYVRSDDITATAYSQASLTDIANNSSINDGDTIWLGYRPDGDWDVYRYTLLPTNIINAVLTIPGSLLTVTTNQPHGLSVGEIISIAQFGTDIPGVYVVKSISDIYTFTLSTTLTAISTPFKPSVGLIFKFISSRLNHINDLANNQNVNRFRLSEKVWVDNINDETVTSTSTWAVYQKTNAYTSNSIGNVEVGISLPINQQFGLKISAVNDVVLVGSPNYKSLASGGGRVSVFRKLGTGTNQLTKLISIDLNSGNTVKSTGTSTTNFGQAVAYDSINTCTIIGAPAISLVKFDRLTLQGINTFTNSSAVTLGFAVGDTGSLFGSDIYVTNTGTVYIGAPGANKVGVVTNYLNTTTVDHYITTSTSGSKFGTSISGTADGSIVAIGAPGHSYVEIHKAGTVSTLVGNTGTNFGQKVLMDSTGDTLFVSAPLAQTVFVYTYSNGSFVLNQTLPIPVHSVNTQFGVDMSMNGDTLVITSTGTGIISYPETDNTYFDSSSTYFYDTVSVSGMVYSYNKIGQSWVYGQEVIPTSLTAGSVYGSSVAVIDNAVFVGAPGLVGDIAQTGQLYMFDQVGETWNQLRVEEPLVDLTTIQRAYTIDTVSDSIQDYLEIIDPIKGRIPGNADEEIKYKTVFDPAVYSLGITGTVNNANSNWLDDHVGELWWDLSSVKYLWAEQGELEFRRNTWNKIFPGCSIDIYEWVGSKYLPSQWAALADTNDGLAQGISGQPKFPNNSVISVKQVYDAVSNNFTNVYYYWVKNKNIIPSAPNRRMTAFNVANLIADPKAQGIRYASFIGNDAVMLTNVKDTLKDNNVHLNVEMDLINNPVKKHTEWLLLQEGSENSYLDINSPILQKIKDSLLGQDSLGNPVPDPLLSDREAYGISFRPRQSMFVDRLAALKNIILYINDVFSGLMINEENYNFERLYATDKPANSADGTYDVIVEDLTVRDALNIRNVQQAVLSVNLIYGRIESVDIINAGFGYGNLVGLDTDDEGNYVSWIGPSVNIVGDGTGAVINTKVNSFGSIIGVDVVNKGTGYTYLNAVVRPYSVVVTLDSTVNNLWSLYTYENNTWSRIHTQSFNVSNYWNYVDWSSSDYTPQRTISKTLDYTYQLAIVDPILQAGAYVRINNPGDNKYIILQKIDPSKGVGTFSSNYNIVYKHLGTIQFSSTLWEYTYDNYGWDSAASWDQTPWSQSNTTEIGYIIDALLIDILNNSLQIYNNRLFFKLVKYALTEQKFVDWAFKTSFIYVNHNAGALSQRPTYKLQDTSYFKSYIEETKPYHTKIRQFQSNYTATELTTAYPTDFDMPSYYNTLSNKFQNVTFGNPLLAQQPYVNWFNNYSYSVSDIVVYDGGSGYRAAPAVTIVPAVGDPGKGATAEAYMALGKVTSIKVTNPGSGYLTAPTVVLSNGGNINSISARAFARISNDKVRNNLIHLKFDRVSGLSEVGTKQTEDIFEGNGSTVRFPLTWYPDTDLTTFTVKINGILVLDSDYTLEFTSAPGLNGYISSVATLVITASESVPQYQDILTVSYNKNIGLYTAVDRIRDYYSPTSGMPGNTATMLMSGLEYGGVTIDTLPFQTSAGWDTVGWAQSVWDDYSGETGLFSVYGNQATTSSSSSTTFTLPFIPPVGQIVNTYLSNINTTTNAVLSTNRVDGTVLGTGTYTITFVGDGITNQITLFTVTNASQLIDFRQSGSDGTVVPSDIDIDSVIQGGGWLGYANTLTISDALADINIDGDGFVTPDNSYGPEENLPGQVSDTLAISVYARPESASPIVLTRRYNIDGTVSTFDIGVSPPNVDSVQVMVGNSQLYRDVDYTIDFANDKINLISSPLVSVNTLTGVYYSTSTVAMRGRGDFSTSLSLGNNTFAGAYNLGFPWTMYGQNFTQVYIGTDGYLTFGGGSSLDSPLTVGVLPYPAIYMEYTDLWVIPGPNASQILDSGESPGIFISQGTLGNFSYWRVRFQASHYAERLTVPAMPAYDFECTLYTNGTDQYVEMTYGNVPNGINNQGDIGAAFGIAPSGSINNPGNGVSVSTVTNYSSHVYYSTVAQGNWVYSGEGSFDPFLPQNQYSSIMNGSKKVMNITTIGLGGENITESEIVNITSANTGTEYVFVSSFSEVQSEYVTINGLPTTDFTLTNSSGSVAINFTNPTNVGDVIQSWFFNAPAKAFNEVHEQIFYSVPLSESVFSLEQPPGTVPPYHNQVVVTFNGRRLTPPEITYYIVENNQTTYDVTYGVDYPYGRISSSDFEIYVNGVLKSYGNDYGFDQLDGLIEFNEYVIKNGDALAVVIKIDSEYTIENDQLVISPTVSRSGVDDIRITTYTNANSMGIRKDRFSGNSYGRYQLSRRVLDSNYVWVDINGQSLTSEVDFKLQNDLQTVVLNSKYKLKQTDTVVITSYESGQNNQTIGFRIFYDNFGRTHYKRLSSASSTQLVEDLLPTDTVITVLDASALSRPDLANRIPGVILVDGERIEFYQVSGNVLGQLKRGALGTGIRDVYPAGTTVMDQGVGQTMRVIDTPKVNEFDSNNKESSLILSSSTTAIIKLYGTTTSYITTVTGYVTTITGYTTVTNYLHSTGSIKSIVLTTGTTWTVPSDFTSFNVIEAWGGGGSGGDYTTRAATGGGGGGYARIVNVPLSPGDIVSISVGHGGDGNLYYTTPGVGGGQLLSVTGKDGTTTVFGGTQASTATSYIYATGGFGGGAGGHGGVGSKGSTLTTFTSFGGAGSGSGDNLISGGGGGAGGPNGNGGTGTQTFHEILGPNGWTFVGTGPGAGGTRNSPAFGGDSSTGGNAERGGDGVDSSWSLYGSGGGGAGNPDENYQFGGDGGTFGGGAGGGIYVGGDAGPYRTGSGGAGGIVISYGQSIITPVITTVTNTASIAVTATWAITSTVITTSSVVLSNIYPNDLTKYSTVTYSVITGTDLSLKTTNHIGIINEDSTIITQVYTLTEVLSTSSLFEITGLVFSSTLTNADVSSQASVYYQGIQLRNTTAEVKTHLNDIAYDSGVANSLGESSDIILPNEYFIFKVGNRYFLELLIPLESNAQIKVVQNTTQIWWDTSSELSLVDQNTEEARFLRSSPVNLPDKYLYAQIQTGDVLSVYVEEDGGTLDFEDGEPIIGD